MRNGFNTAGFSEVVHEITNDSKEAKFVYAVRGRRSKLTGLSVHVLPALLGTVKSPRRFNFSLRESWAEVPLGEVHLPTPQDLFLTGIGSCMMTTLVGGASARHLDLEGADVVLTLSSRDSTTSGFAEAIVSAQFNLTTSSDDSQCQQLVDRVAEQSPNYVSVISGTPVDIVTDLPPHVRSRVEHWEPLANPISHVEPVTTSWISGPQCLVITGGRDEGTSLRADAPKQLTGVDWGPNPQEYLLAGLAAEMAGLLFTNSVGTPIEGQAWDVVSTGVEDVRGFLGVGSGVTVGLQDVDCRIIAPRGSDELIAEIISQAIRNSELAALLVIPVPIELSWRKTMDQDRSNNRLVLRPGIGE
ncbi:OsmC family protein [Rathayibacter iranicus]|uniref:OsmC-like protein n=2 Tax=Rathayibacter iranicus TaxID=59737 RepID=A0AAD1EM52_9MICO|nr:OsmC family protein [Rathayibacter iranicus]AZZ55693.1 hypothetical protein C7V51_07210 [Rathayibacter iranicus]MWV31180.1 hypothetical protein [Rathayibacter iranicus NCPPB 2253 = VKM Ac-1602]PPI47758.1 hypothetical protein C5E09_06250 [Rathayibacter iranicus]PPI61114.1 hypothetical protein C5E08_07185 [Rathayibacter iranicus]PPI73138.1 hypothetical protein C5E01_03470 [Rathayibacter iranicus]